MEVMVRLPGDEATYRDAFPQPAACRAPKGGKGGRHRLDHDVNPCKELPAVT